MLRYQTAASLLFCWGGGGDGDDDDDEEVVSEVRWLMMKMETKSCDVQGEGHMTSAGRSLITTQLLNADSAQP